MHRTSILLLLMSLALAPAWAQEADPDTTDDAEAVENDVSGAEDVTDEEIEELLGLGDEEYTELEDDFDPTEEVRFEQSIPFPTDI